MKGNIPKVIVIFILIIFIFIPINEKASALIWSIETVDDESDVGRATSIALDNNGYPHISYYDVTNSDLKYACWNGSDWDIQTVDSAGQVGRHTSLALDSNGYPHISYHSFTFDDLKYARWTGSDWSIEIVDSSNVHIQYTSITIDSNDYPHISYYTWLTSSLKHANWTGSSWNIEVVDSGGGKWSSIALDNNGNPHISYYKEWPEYDLKYAKWNGSSWSKETVDSVGDIGWYSSLKLDSNDFPRISYYDGSKGDLKYARWNGSDWNIETVDSIDQVGGHTSIVLDGSDYPHISYFDFSNGNLKYAKWTGSDWTNETVDSSATVGWETSIALNISGYPQISYYDASNGILKFAKKIPDTTPPNLMNLQPPDTTITNDNTPTITANYSDNSGIINTTSVMLIVAGADVTSSALIGADGIIYTPTTSLLDGVQNVYLEVRDYAGNLATATWSFSVETTPPIITNLQPPDSSATNDNTPIISANYSDSLGINVSKVLLSVDGEDVTSSAVVTTIGVTYTPGIAEADGSHNVYLEVKDNVDNLATASWSFTIDTKPPTITNLQPTDTSTTSNNKLIISANYTDSIGVNSSSVVLKLDGGDITSLSIVTVSGVTHTPATTLADGIHNVYLEVRDNIGNLASTTCTFIVDTTSPNANTGDDKWINVGETINFNGSDSLDNLNNLNQLNFIWNITKDGNLIITLYGIDPTFTFDNEGQYEVNLTVQDTAGNEGYDVMIVTVSQPMTPQDDFLAQFWWVFLIIVIVIIVVTLVLLWRRKKKSLI